MSSGYRTDHKIRGAQVRAQHLQQIPVQDQHQSAVIPGDIQGALEHWLGDRDWDVAPLCLQYHLPFSPGNMIRYDYNYRYIVI